MLQKGDTKSREEPALLKAKGDTAERTQGAQSTGRPWGGVKRESVVGQHKENCRVPGHLLCDLPRTESL